MLVFKEVAHLNMEVFGMHTAINEIHNYWFGELDEAGLSNPDLYSLWFQSTEASDQQCRDQFGELVETALAGGLGHWEQSDPGLVALIILLDQFTRNIYRHSPKSFAGDPRALDLAKKTVTEGHHQRLPAIHQVFLYLPLEHSESADDQQECVELFQQLEQVTGNPTIAGFTRYAVAHQEVIAQFGRFPHRNAILGRQSSAQELAHLEKHGGF